MAAKKKSPTKKSPTKTTAKATTAKRTAPASEPSSEPSSDTARDAEGLQQYEALLPRARALPAKDVLRVALSTEVVLANVREGTAALLAEEARLARELPTLDLAIVRAAPDVALALHFAATQAAAGDGTSDLRALISEGAALRGLLLRSAEALVEAGLLDAKTVAAIRKGKGALDAASDLVQLAALFQSNAAALRGKSPATSEQIRRAAALGSDLLARIHPKGTRRTKVGEAAVYADDRNRLGTLLVADWELARRAAAWLFGSEQTVVRALGSVTRSQRKPAKPAS